MPTGVERREQRWAEIAYLRPKLTFEDHKVHDNGHIYKVTVPEDLKGLTGADIIMLTGGAKNVCEFGSITRTAPNVYRVFVACLHPCAPVREPIQKKAEGRPPWEPKPAFEDEIIF